MNWTWIVGGVAAALGVGALLYFFGLAAVLKLVGDVVRFLADSARHGLAWLRKPGSPTKAVCAVLAFMSLTFGIQSMQRGQVIVRQHGEFIALQTLKEREEAALQAEPSLRDQRIEQFRDLARQQMALLEAQRLESKAAVEAAFKAGEEAAKSNAKFQAEFAKRPPECKAALEVMAAACSTLKDY